MCVKWNKKQQKLDLNLDRAQQVSEKLKEFYKFIKINQNFHKLIFLKLKLKKFLI